MTEPPKMRSPFGASEFNSLKPPQGQSSTLPSSTVGTWRSTREPPTRGVGPVEGTGTTVAAETGRLRGRIGRAVAASEHGGCKDAIQDMLSILLDDGPEPGS